jgi:hypothetical protein
MSRGATFCRYRQIGGLEQFTRVTVGLIDERWDIEMRVAAGEPFFFLHCLAWLFSQEFINPRRDYSNEMRE